MKSIIVSLMLVLGADIAAASVNNVNKILISTTGSAYLQVSEVVAISGGIDVATLANGAIAEDDGTGSYIYQNQTAPPNNAINGIGPESWPNIYHSDTAGNQEYLLITLNGSYTLNTLSIFGRSDCCSVRDVYDVQLLDTNDNVLFFASEQSAYNSDNKAVVDLPVDASTGEGVNVPFVPLPFLLILSAVLVFIGSKSYINNTNG